MSRLLRRRRVVKLVFIAVTVLLLYVLLCFALSATVSILFFTLVNRLEEGYVATSRRDNSWETTSRTLPRGSQVVSTVSRGDTHVTTRPPAVPSDDSRVIGRVDDPQVMISAVPRSDVHDSESLLRLFNTGEAELLQLRQYVRLVKNDNYFHLSRNLTPSSYTFSVMDVTVLNYSLAFTVHQQYINTTVVTRPLIGGASFYVTVIGERHWTTCRTTDSFNGRYVVECPMYDRCVNVTATVYYADFGAFYRQQLDLESYSMFWSKKSICKPDGFTPDETVLRQTYTGWYRKPSRLSSALEGYAHEMILKLFPTLINWTWMNRGKSVKASDELRKCIAGAPVSFIGDSHLRAVYYYLLGLFGSLTPEQRNAKLRDSMTFRVFNYTYAASILVPHHGNSSSPLFPPFFPNAWRLITALNQREHLTSVENMDSIDSDADGMTGKNARYNSKFSDSYVNISTGYQQFIILSIGTWDVSLYNVRYFLDTFLPTLSNFTRELQRLASAQRIKVIFVTMPACLHGPRPLHRSGPEGRNNPRLAALNRLLTETLTGQGITVVDYFAPTILRQAETEIDTFHYYFTPGSAGDAVARLVLQELCT